MCGYLSTFVDRFICGVCHIGFECCEYLFEVVFDLFLFVVCPCVVVDDESCGDECCEAGDDDEYG